MSKPTLTIITTPASAPATEPPTPAYDEEPSSAHLAERSPSTGQLQSPSDCSDELGSTGRQSPSTEEVVGTPGIAQDGGNRSSVGVQEEAGKAKAWSSTISSSESVPVGLRLPPIPDETTLRNLAEQRSRSRSGSRSPTAGPVPRFATGKEGTRSLPSLKDTVRQQSGRDQSARGRSPLAQANASGPSASPPSPPSKSGPSGFKAFLMKTFGIGKSSSDKQKKKDRTPVASPSPSSKPRNQPTTIARIKSPVAVTPTAATPTSFVRISGSRSPPTLATPIFASTSAPQPLVSHSIQSSTLAPPHSPADVPLPPSPLITQGSPVIPSAEFAASTPFRSEGPASVETRKSEGSEETKIATSEMITGTEADVDSRRTDRSGDLSSSEGTRVAMPEQGKFGSTATVVSDDEADDKDGDGLVMAKPKTRSSPGRASIKSNSNKIMSAIEPRQAPPFSTSPVNASQMIAGHASVTGKSADLHGGVTMSRSVTAEGMKEAEEIMGEKQQVLQEASEKLAAIASTRPRTSVDSEEEEAKDSVGADLGFPPRITARKVSPTPSSGIPKYGRSISAPAGERIISSGSVASGTAKDGFIRKPSLNAGSGLTRSGSKLRTSVYGLTDILHKKETTPKQKRISASPTMHTMGTIMKEANEIMDQDERDRAESFFMS